MAFPTRSCASSAMVSRRSDRLDVSNPPSRLSMRAIRGPRLVRPGLVARTRGDARRPENGIIRPFHRSPRPPSLAGCGSQAHPYARSASEPTLPEAETARCGSARTHRAGQDRQDLAQGARATTSRAPPSSFSSKRINPFRCRSIARPDPIRLPFLREGPPGQARPSPRPKASARRRRIGDPSHVRDCRFRTRSGSARGGVSPSDAPPPDGVIVLRLVPRAPRTSLDPR